MLATTLSIGVSLVNMGISKAQQIADDIDLLLENSELSDSPDFLVNGSQVTYSGDKEQVSPADDIKLNQKQALLISKVFYQQPKAKQESIRGYLIDKLNVGGGISRTATNVLVQIGSVEPLLDKLITDFDDSDQEGFVRSLQQINQVLYCWPGTFSKPQVKKLRLWCDQTLKANNKLGDNLTWQVVRNQEVRRLVGAIYRQTNHILVHDITQRIEAGFNPDINEDEQRLKDEFNKFGFPQDLSEALNKIDEKLQASRDAFDFKGTMDLIRAFTERLYRSILDQYEDGPEIDSANSEKVAEFFTAKGLVPDNFAKMIVHQRHFLSDLAAHRLKSREEDARLSKNMVIEMSLYLLRRFENH